MMIIKALAKSVSALVMLFASVTAQADVFNMGGTRDPMTGAWTGSASLEFVTVGDAGNVADSNGWGSVGYNYQIGKYDITAAQYCQFLNAIARTGDPYGLYNIYMSTGHGLQACGISCSATYDGNYSYQVTPGDVNVPVNCVSWGSAVRFCNWLQNNQPATGAEDATTTEDGAYTLNGATSHDALFTVTRNSCAKYWLPTEDEWYKAAYFDPNKPGGAGYWLFPTKNDLAPSNVLSSAGTNNANIEVWNGHMWTFTVGNCPGTYLTAVGSFAASPGPYGTYDQGGDACQWVETSFYTSWSGWERGWRGADWAMSSDNMKSSMTYATGNYPENALFGFRVASVPEPSIIVSLVGLGVIGLFVRSLQRRRCCV